MEKLYRMIEWLFLAELGAGIANLIRKTSEFSFVTDKETEMYFFMIILITVMIKTIIFVALGSEGSDFRENFRYIVIALLIALVFCTAFISLGAETDYSEGSRYYFLVLIAIATLGTIGTDYTKVIRIHVAVLAFMLAVIIIAALSGAIENLVYYRGGNIRSSWGIVYPTDMATYFVYFNIFSWIAFREKTDLWFLIPGTGALIMAYCIADSNTSTIIIILFMVCLVISRYMKNRKPEKFTKFAEMTACCVFPLFSILMNLMIPLYNRGNRLSEILNQFIHERIGLAAQAYAKYGIGLFGSSLKQHGNGGGQLVAAANSVRYDFVDSTYHLIPLNYGLVIFILVNVLWVLMIRNAAKIKDYRLVCGMTLIAVHSLSEPTYIVPWYNILILLPVSIMMTKKTASYGEGQDQQSIQGTMQKRGIIASAIAAVLGIILFYNLLPWARTIFTFSAINDSPEGLKTLFWIFVVCTAGVIAACCLLHKVMDCSIKDRDRKIFAAILAVLIFMAGAFIWKCNALIVKIADREARIVLADKEAIEIIGRAKTGKLYVNGLPEIYRRKYDGISTSIFDGEDIARLENATIITDASADMTVPFLAGFSYSQITDEHAVYTNDSGVIKALEESGYHITPYNSSVIKVDMSYMAEINGIEQQDDGSIILKGGESALTRGPFANLSANTYSFIYDLSIDKECASLVSGSDKEICNLLVTSGQGTVEIGNVVIRNSDFDDSGNCRAELRYDVPVSIYVEMKVIPAEGKKVEIRGLAYQKTPD